LLPRLGVGVLDERDWKTSPWADDWRPFRAVHRRQGRSITAPSGSFTVPPIGMALTNSLSVSAKIW
jgi:hypothetical protein